MRKVGFSKVFAKTGDMSRKDWLVARSHGIGGSDVAQIVGVSKWGNALKVYLSKIDPLGDNETSVAAEIGIKIEDFVAQLWQERHPHLRLEKVNAILQHPEYPWAFASIDRVVIDRESNKVVGIYEGKTAGIKKDWAEDDVPDDYYLQGQWYLAVTGLGKIYYGALLGGFGGFAMECPTFDSDPELIKDLFGACENFWEMVKNKTPPAIDGSAASAKIIKQLYPMGKEDTTIDLPPSADLMLAAYMDAKKAAKNAKTHEDSLANQLKMLVGEADHAFGDMFVITWKNSTSSRFDSKRFALEEPTLHEKYCKESKSRRFLVKEKK